MVETDNCVVRFQSAMKDVNKPSIWTDDSDIKKSARQLHYLLTISTDIRKRVYWKHQN